MIKPEELQDAIKALVDTVTQLSQVEHDDLNVQISKLSDSLDSFDGKVQLDAVSALATSLSSLPSDADLYAIMSAINCLETKASKKLEVATTPANTVTAPVTLESLMAQVKALQANASKGK